MDYDEFVQSVSSLDFMQDTDTADAAIKAILGILASSMDDKEARDFTSRLPEPLTLERLRGHQVRPTRISVEEFVSEIQEQFKLTNGQARLLINKVLEGTEQITGLSTRRLYVETGTQ